MTITSDERQRILAEIDQTWNELITVLRGFDRTELQDPGVVGIWSLKDVLGHLETWDRIAIRKLELAEAGDDRPWYEADGMSANGIDEFNESDAEAKQDVPVDTLWSQLYATHDELLNRVRESPALSRELIAVDTCDHYRGHLNDIQAWQRSKKDG